MEAYTDLSPVLRGRLIVLEPLRPEHEEALRAAADDERVWRYMRVVASDPGAFHRWFGEALAAAAAAAPRRPFCIVRRADGAVVGSSRYLSLRPEDRVLEIGYSWIAPDAWGSGANTEAKLLLLGHAFERLGCLRVEFKTDASNERSRAALAALPARVRGRLPQAHAGARRPAARLRLVQRDRRRLAGREGRARGAGGGEGMSERRHHSTHTEFEARIGYDRAVRVGDVVHVSGTLGIGPDGRPPEGAYAQSVASLERIQAALEAVGASLADVVRTRMYVVDVERHQFDVGRAHGEYFADVRPASTMIGIAGLVGPEFLVEIEVEAIVAPDSA